MTDRVPPKEQVRRALTRRWVRTVWRAGAALRREVDPEQNPRQAGMAAILFEVEQTAWIAQDLPVVLARILVPQVFSLGPEATLGGCRLAQFLEIPAALRADGSPRPDLFAFALVDADDLAQFTPGEVVELRPEGSRPST